MTTQKPGIFFIVLDTHRADRLGMYGCNRGTSPNLDAFAQTSTVFEKAISPAQWTIPSHASMFSGEYPSVHTTLQSADALGQNFTTIAEHLSSQGYRNTGFCNNPLVGVLDNEFRRGFDRFYNYGGTVPFTPSTYSDHPSALISRLRRYFYNIVDRVSKPIQQAVAASPEVLKIALNPWLVPLWTRYSNFKGDTGTSIRDSSRFLENIRLDTAQIPPFIFLNLMETHLPYTPPRRFIQKFAPIVLDEPEASDFIRMYNTQALQWLLPLAEPYPALEAETINRMYDAEVAYQDHLLHQLLSILDRPEYRENFLVIIVGDHGEMLGEHQIMGHGLGVYEELVHVPLIVRFPGQEEGSRVESTVSIVNLYHTILDQVGIESTKTSYGETIPTANKSWAKIPMDTEYVYSEAYAPTNLITIVEKYAPDLMGRFDCKATRWAVYNKQFKLIRTQNSREEIFDYISDPKEQNPLSQHLPQGSKLSQELEDFLISSRAKSSGQAHALAGNLADETVIQRLRNLGYIE